MWGKPTSRVSPHTSYSNPHSQFSLVMSPRYSTGGNSRKLECDICHREYSKAEHLIRHTRTHTGIKPFACKICGRSFNRQDSLARHEKLHSRSRDTASDGFVDANGRNEVLQPSNHLTMRGSVPSTISPLAEHLPIAHVGRTLSQGSTTNGVAEVADMEPQLIWPDSEDLFQTIMSSEVTGQHAIACSFLPFPSNSDFLNFANLSSQVSVEGGEEPPRTISTADGALAVRHVSQMISEVSNHVTEEVNSSSITSMFLDECLHMFFTRFNRTFPILHRPTFVFRECTHPLLLNAIALGSLYLGQNDAVAKGETLWRLAHTAVATSWQTLITHHGTYDASNGIQLVLTALLGQIYATLSKNRALRTTSQVFHALGFFWARHCSMFDIEPQTADDVPCVDLAHAEKVHRWKIWVAREIQRRAILGHYVLDGQIAQFSGDPTAARHAANGIAIPIHDAAFGAEDVDSWVVAMSAEEPREVSFRDVFCSLFSGEKTNILANVPQTPFTLRVVLEGLQSFVSESDFRDGAVVGIPTKSQIRAALARFYDTIISSGIKGVDRLELLLRWHTICLDVAADSPVLCKYLCARYNIAQNIFGGGKVPKSLGDIDQWIDTEDARRAVLHAIAVQDIAEQLPQGRSYAIHVPSSLFSAATIYAAFSLVGTTTLKLPRSVDWRDSLLPAANASPANGDRTRTLADLSTRRFLKHEPLESDDVAAVRNLFYEMNSIMKLFRCLASQWGLAHEMGLIVDRWISLCH